MSWSGAITVTLPSLESHCGGGKCKRTWWSEIMSLSILEKSWGTGKGKGVSEEKLESAGHRKPVRQTWSWAMGRCGSTLLWRVEWPDGMINADDHSGRGTWGQESPREGMRGHPGFRVQSHLCSLSMQPWATSHPLWPSDDLKASVP